MLIRQETAFIEIYLFIMCPPVIIMGIALVIWTIGVAGLAGIGVSLPLLS